MPFDPQIQTLTIGEEQIPVAQIASCHAEAQYDRIDHPRFAGPKLRFKGVVRWKYVLKDGRELSEEILLNPDPIPDGAMVVSY